MTLLSEQEEEITFPSDIADDVPDSTSTEA